MAANPSDALERALHYPLGDTLPAPGTSLEVAPGVRWLRMGLPFALNHINLWLLRDVQDGVQGWTIVDCGIDNAPTRALWEQIFATELQGLVPAPDAAGRARQMRFLASRGFGTEAIRRVVSGGDD